MPLEQDSQAMGRTNGNVGHSFAPAAYLRSLLGKIELEGITERRRGSGQSVLGVSNYCRVSCFMEKVLEGTGNGRLNKEFVRTLLS